MIGWTKTRKRCPEHGLVLRKHPEEYRNRANYCPACGKQLTVVSVPYLFQIYFHPAIMIVPGILLFLGGLFFFLDVRGCVIEDRKTAVIDQAAQDARHSDLRNNLPEDWQVLYAAIKHSSDHYMSSNSFDVLEDYFERLEEGKKMSRLTSEEVRMFLDLMPGGQSDDGFQVISQHMGETR